LLLNDSRKRYLGDAWNSSNIEKTKLSSRVWLLTLLLLCPWITAITKTPRILKRSAMQKIIEIKFCRYDYE